MMFRLLGLCFVLGATSGQETSSGDEPGGLGFSSDEFSAPEALSEACIKGTFRCYGEGTNGGDYNGPNLFSIGGEAPGDEIGVVSAVPGSTFGAIMVNITAPNPDLPGGMFTEFEVCRPDPLNGVSQFPRYRCVTTVRNDQPEGNPTVLIDMTYTSCNEWTKTVVDFGANTGVPGIFEVRCTRKET